MHDCISAYSILYIDYYYCTEFKKLLISKYPKLFSNLSNIMPNIALQNYYSTQLLHIKYHSQFMHIYIYAICVYNILFNITTII